MTRIPPQYRQALSTFDSAFHDDRNRSSFQTLTSALILAEDQWSIAALTRGISHPDAKCRTAYSYFLGYANWSAQSLAQQLVEYTLSQRNIGDGDHLLMHIDDTFVGKSGNATHGVADLHNPATGEEEWGNKFVTSCLQVGDIYVPYRAQMYIPQHLSDNFDQPFKTKLEIAVEDILKPLQLPAGVACTVVADNAYMAADEVSEICGLGYDVVTRLRTDRRIQPPTRFGKQSVESFAETLEYEEITVSVRGGEQTYLAADTPVFLPGLGSMKLVATKDAENDEDGEGDEPDEDDEECRYYVSTNLDLLKDEILRSAEHRWNIETLHQESNEKFGFDQYELENKQAIERFLQLIFIAWTVTVIASESDAPVWDDQGGLAARLDELKQEFLVETVETIWQRVDQSVPEVERRQQLRAVISDLSWYGLSITFVSENIFLVHCYIENRY